MAAPQINRAGRLAEAITRDGASCVWCGRCFDGLVVPTTEHLVPRIKGGPSWLQNEVAACRRCNSERGHMSAALWLEECRRRGWRPDLRRVLARLTDLDAAITERGGQRRARAYVTSQLRRLNRL